MELLQTFIDLFLHIDERLVQVINYFGIVSYLILFLIIFMETGFVVTPFLPGDSLLFAAGAIAATKSLDIFILWIILMIAAVLGDTANYWIGHFVGPKAFHPNAHIPLGIIKIRVNRILKQAYLDKAEKFYEKHGGKAIILARFVPIVRTFAPFVAGVGKMNYSKFISFNIIGGIAWVSLFVFGGFFFGNIPIIQENFHYAVVIIIFVSVIPILYEWHKSRSQNNVT